MIFDIEKWERIKNRREDVVQAYRAANEDWQFEKGSFEKIAVLYGRDFHQSNAECARDGAAISLLRRMNPQDITAINLKVKETLALVETGTSHHRRLTELLTQLIVMKRAEARKERSAEVQQNNTRCFGMLEEFARKHIKLPLSSGPAPVGDSPATIDFYMENQ
jgi:hypothetical protein